MPIEAMTEKLAKGRSARSDYEGVAARRARRKESDRELTTWAAANFPERQTQAFVAASMLRSIYGHGRVTRAMVKRRMEAHDKRFGLDDETVAA